MTGLHSGRDALPGWPDPRPQQVNRYWFNERCIECLLKGASWIGALGYHDALDEMSLQAVTEEVVTSADY